MLFLNFSKKKKKTNRACHPFFFVLVSRLIPLNVLQPNFVVNIYREINKIKF